MSSATPPSSAAQLSCAAPLSLSFWQRWRTPLVFVAACVMYGLSALAVGHTETPVNSYFDHLARNFAEGRLHLEGPPGVHDLTRHDGRWYVPFPPLPAVLMLPWVAVFGEINTVVVSILLAAAGVAFVGSLLETLRRSGALTLTAGATLWLTGLFAAGCVHWYMAIAGNVWLTGQISGVTFFALAACLAARPAPGWASGLALGVALWGRTNLLLGWPLLLGLAAESCRGDAGRLRRWAVSNALPVVLSIAGLMLYNYARFEHPLDFGYTNQNVDNSLLEPLQTTGWFSPVYIPRNLEVMLLGLPQWQPRRGLLIPDDRGMSVFLTTPALVYLWLARKRSPAVRGAWLAVVLLLLPIIAYYNTGWQQFGYRFSLDLMVPLIVLLASTVDQKPSLGLRLLILAGVAVNAWGAWWWYHRPVG